MFWNFHKPPIIPVCVFALMLVVKLISQLTYSEITWGFFSKWKLNLECKIEPYWSRANSMAKRKSEQDRGRHKVNKWDPTFIGEIKLNQTCVSFRRRRRYTLQYGLTVFALDRALVVVFWAEPISSPATTQTLQRGLKIAPAFCVGDKAVPELCPHTVCMHTVCELI